MLEIGGESSSPSSAGGAPAGPGVGSVSWGGPRGQTCWVLTAPTHLQRGARTPWTWLTPSVVQMQRGLWQKCMEISVIQPGPQPPSAPCFFFFYDQHQHDHFMTSIGKFTYSSEPWFSNLQNGPGENTSLKRAGGRGW